VLRSWYSEHRYGNVTTPEFIDLAERVSGQDLAQFFDTWLYEPGKPAGLDDGVVASTTAPHRR
jgi:aminopeptidase N